MGSSYPVQGGGEPDPIQVCRCHTHKPATKGQFLYKPGNWKMGNDDMHLTGCPVLKELRAGGFGIISTG